MYPNNNPTTIATTQNAKPPIDLSFLYSRIPFMPKKIPTNPEITPNHPNGLTNPEINQKTIVDAEAFPANLADLFFIIITKIIIRVGDI